MEKILVILKDYGVGVTGMLIVIIFYLIRKSRIRFEYGGLGNKKNDE